MKATLGGQAKDLEPDSHHMSVIGGVLDSPRSSWMGSFIAQIKRALAYLPMGETERPNKAWWACEARITRYAIDRQDSHHPDDPNWVTSG